MATLASISDFEQLQSRIQGNGELRKSRLIICAGTACQASHANDILRAAKKIIIDRRLHDKLSLRITGCHGFCEMAPFILAEPRHAFYAKLTPADVPRIIDAVFADEYVEELLYRDPVTDKPCLTYDEMPFYANQKRLILGMNQRLDPIRINDYIAQGGYGVLRTVLAERRPEYVIEQVIESGLRGRGGAGFPTGRKWQQLARQPGNRGRILVCNADEGDPGAYMDSGVLEGNPHSVIEGMIIGAYAVGAGEGIVYVRNEYPLAIKHLTIALRQCRDLGLLGENILGSGLSFDIDIVRGAGAFVCGEETALIRSIEGKVGEPIQRPPYPVERGIEGKPTAINNVETWANIPLILRMGAEEYAKVGVPGNTGTKIFSLVGKIRNTGLVEVPMGTTISEIVHDIGGGPSGSARIKAVQTGGPSGGCIPAEHFDLPIDYDRLTEAGSIMGSGGLIVMDENTCMVDVARYFMNFLRDESCGKCFTCRKGIQRMYEILEDISRGEASLEDLDLLEELAHVVKDTTLCGLGQSAPNPVLSALRYFRGEFEEHIRHKRCRAFVCPDLVGAPCQAACPIGTEAWRYVAHIARGEYEEAYRAIREANPFPSVCARVCSHPCERHCRSGTAGTAPIAIRALKRFITDRIDPRTYRPRRTATANGPPPVAIVGSGPAGLTAAHYLSLAGHRVTVFEADDRPGGMLVSGIPAYRLPRETLAREIESLIDENVTLRCNVALGRDITLDALFDEGFKAVYLALGAHKSRRLNVEGEDIAGVHPAIRFLKDFNLRGESCAHGRVGVIGGGDSAVDAAGIALRQPGVERVDIFYRRTREEMPALERDIDAAIEEGVTLHTLVSPVRIQSEGGRLRGVECVRNRLGAVDASGRRRPEPIVGSEFFTTLDTLIVTIGDVPDIDFITSMGVEVTDWGTVRADDETLATSRPGVFAGGDVVTGPATVVDAIAAGKKAATMIGRYLRGENLVQPVTAHVPDAFVEPVPVEADELEHGLRAEPPVLPAATRRAAFDEIERAYSEDDARREARRCLRCDLEFTGPHDTEHLVPVTVGATA